VLIEIKRQERFDMKNKYRCPHCCKRNRTESIVESFHDYHPDTQKVWGTCGFCGDDFQLQGKQIILKVVIPVHSQCRCGRHFLFNLVRDARIVRFSRMLGSPFVRCPYCRRQVFLQTPEKPFQYWLSVWLQRLRIFVARQRRALGRLFEVTRDV